MRVKICGTTSVADGLLAREAGADFLGIVVEHPPSLRSVGAEVAAEIARAVMIPVVLVTVNLPIERLLRIAEVVRPHALQLHGDDGAERLPLLVKEGRRVWPVLNCKANAEQVRREAAGFVEGGAEAVLLDARETTPTGVVYGGTGLVSDWQLARELVQDGVPLVLAGGLSPENVARAVARVRPWAVDVVSGVERAKGIKDKAAVRQFVAAARCP